MTGGFMRPRRNTPAGGAENGGRLHMTIDTKRDGSKLTVALEGRLDTTTAPQLEAELRPALEGVTELVFDLKDLAYVSSAGLRVLLSAQKTMNKQGSMVVRGANADLLEIFDVTGFSDILNIES